MQLKLIKAKGMKYERIKRSSLTKVASLLCKKIYKGGICILGRLLYDE